MSVLSKFTNKLQDRFLRNVITLMTGTTLAQVIGFITIPIITRLYSPEQFGSYQNFTTLISVIMVIACLRYEQAIVLPEQKKDAYHLFVLSLIMTFITSAVVLLLCIIFKVILISFFKITNISLIIPVSLFFIGVFQALNYWFIRTQFFKVLAFSKLIQITSTVILQIIFVFVGTTESGLIYGFILGQIIVTILLYVQQKLNIQKEFYFSSISVHGLINQAKKYKKFPLVNAATSLIDNLAAALPTFFFTIFFGNSITGQFGLAYRVINLPISLIGTSIAQVFLPKIAEIVQTQGDIYPIVLQAIKRMAIISLTILLVLQLSPWLFKLAFGDGWELAGTIAQIMSIAIALRFVVSPLSSVLIICDKQGILALWQLMYMLSTTIAMLVSLMFQSVLMTVVCLVISDVGLYGIYLYLIIRTSKQTQFRTKVLGE